jgi:hypothetical protein
VKPLSATSYTDQILSRYLIDWIQFELNPPHPWGRLKNQDRREAFDVCSFLNGGERPNLIGWLDAGEEAREYEAGLEAKTKAIDEKEERKF